jgi:hypothetical protein
MREAPAAPVAAANPMPLTERRAPGANLDRRTLRDAPSSVLTLRTRHRGNMLASPTSSPALFRHGRRDSGVCHESPYAGPGSGGVCAIVGDLMTRPYE